MKQRLTRWVILLCLGFLALFVGPHTAGGDVFFRASGSADPPFHDTYGNDPEMGSMIRLLQESERIRVIVQLNMAFVPEGKIAGPDGVRSQRSIIARSQDHVAKALQNSRSEEIHRFGSLPLVVLEVDAAGLNALMNDPQVLSIHQDRIVPPLLDDAVPFIGADAVRAEGAEGAGQVVAVLDTGVDTSHAFLADKIVSEACYSTTSTQNGSTTLCPAGSNPGGSDSQTGPGAGANCSSLSSCDHGTHVAGIAVGSGTFSGVAPGADLISIQVFSEFSGSICSPSVSPCVLSYTSDQIRALERIYELRDTYSIAAVNMSLGSEVYTDQNACDSENAAIKVAIDMLRSVDIPVVIAAGNSGSGSGLSFPGCISSAVSVGSVDLGDNVSSFSNTAAFLDFYAPGSAIYSSLPGDFFGYKNGTSMAAPMVAGAFALLRSAYPDTVVDEFQAALADTGVPVDDQRSGGTVTGIPRIQVDEAYFTLIPRVFNDVAYNDWAADYIEALYDIGYVAGCSIDPLLYCPDRSMTRGEGAVFVMRGLKGREYFPSIPTETAFDDVDVEQWYAKWAQALWEEGYTAGCGTDPLIFCPENGHTRAEGAVFYLRMLYGLEYFPDPPTGTVFSDVEPDIWYAKWIEAAYADNIYLPCQTEPELLACPLDPLLRDVAAYMMVQAKGGLPLGGP